MVAKWFARLLAPIALIAVGLGVYLLVHANFAHHVTTTVTQSSTAIVNGRRHPIHSGGRVPKFYRVRPGESLSSVAAKTGVSMGTLMSLNPALAQSPNNLQTGQRLRLRR